MGPLVENLQQLGYVYGDNLLAAGVRAVCACAVCACVRVPCVRASVMTV
jgi:hypothetical protein